MRFDKLPENTFQTIQFNAAMLLSSFDPATGAVVNTNILGATTGGINASCVPSFSDFGEDIDNCPNNMAELNRITGWAVKASGTYVTVTPESLKSMIGAADADTTGEVAKITPRGELTINDFKDIWIVGDYSDKNGAENGGFLALHIMNALSTAGFSLQTTKNGKGQFAFEYTGHTSILEQDKVPFEAYIRSGTAEPEE